LEEKIRGHNNYHPLPVVFNRGGEFFFVWDVEGKKYYDFYRAYSVQQVNQGACHPKIISAMSGKRKRLPWTSRAFYNDMFGKFEKLANRNFGF